jgi:hypothetical protein
MVDTLGDTQGGTGKRSAPTIEGTATEVSVEAPADNTAAESAEAKLDKETAEPEDVGGSGEGSEPEPEALQTRDEPEPMGRKGPPPASTIPEMKSFATHLVAGMLGGLIGVIALAFAWHLIPTGKGESSAELAKIKDRIARLELTPAPAPDTKALADLEARVKALESRPVETPPDISGLTDRVTQLEAEMKTLADAAKNGGSVTDAAAITQQITEVEQRIQANLDKTLADQREANAKTLQKMQASIDDVNAKVAALAEAGPGQSALTALMERVAKLETEINKRATDTKSAAAAIAFANLSSAIAEGRPYATELATIKSFVPDPGDLGPLPAYAEKGIPTVPELTRSFGANRDAALSAAAPVPSGSLIDRLLASVSTLVKVTRVDEAATGDSASAVLARAEALLDKGDLAGPVKQIETLDGAPREAFKAWLADAQARLAADAILQRLEATLLASASNTPQKAQD